MNLSKCLPLALAALFGGACLPAQAVVIDFEDLPHADELTGAGTIYFSKGFTLSYAPAPGEPYPVGFTTVGPSWRFNGRSAALTANSCSATTTLVAGDNNPVTLKAIDLAALNGPGGNPISVTFVGLTSNGTTVQETIELGGKKTWKKYNFPHTFKNLQSVTWTQGDCSVIPPHMFDNIRVSPSWKEDKDD